MGHHTFITTRGKPCRRGKVINVLMTRHFNTNKKPGGGVFIVDLEDGPTFHI